MEPEQFVTHAATIPGMHPDGTTDTDGEGRDDADSEG
jgi:hypothetical protein